MQQIIDFLPWLGSLIAIGITIGGLIIAIRGGYSKEAAAIQEKVIAALKEQVETLDQKIKDLEEDRNRQDRIIATIRHALKEHGLRIMIEGDYVTVAETAQSNKKITRIRSLADDESDDEKEAK